MKQLMIQAALLFSLGFFLVNSKEAIAQSDTLNRFNVENKKDGYWKVLLDKKADRVTGISDAYFYGIELWDNGERVFEYSKHHWEDKLVFDGVMPVKGQPVFLTGTFKSFDKKGRLMCEETYENGFPVSIKSYMRSSDKKDNSTYLFEYLDFSKKYNNIPGTYYYEEHFYGPDRIYRYWFRKGNKGWRVYEIKN